MKRKFLSLILVFAMTVSLLTVGTGAVEPTYGDTAGHWAESSIERWSGHGIIQGSNGLFDPNGQLTCAQLATILAKLLKLPVAKDAGFTDNTADAWYYDAINRCAAAGILNGNGDGTVTPEAPITRERAMVMLARALGIEPIRKPNLTKYTDAAQVSAYAQGYVAALIEAGIVGGVTADELAPQDNINRASTVTILDRAISTYADQAGETVKADGKGLVLVVAKNVKITGAPEGTKIVVADGATGLTVNGKSVSDDQTYIVPKTEPAKPSSGSSGGSVHTHAYTTFVTDWSTMTTVKKCSCGATQTVVSSNTYYIANDTDLKAFRDSVNQGHTFAGKTIKLMADITVSAWTPIGQKGSQANKFMGTFDGNGKIVTIDGIANNLDTAFDGYAAFFGATKDATIQNLTVAGTISGKDVAGIIGKGENTTLTNCHNNATINSTGGKAAGIAASFGGSLTNCTNSGDVTTSVAQPAGGLVAWCNTSTITECQNSGKVTVSGTGDNSQAGGLCGNLGSGSTVTNCSNSGEVSASLAGGVAGRAIGANTKIIAFSNEGTVTGENYAGGVIGDAKDGVTAQECTISGTISAANAAGGIFGSVHGTNNSAITNCAVTSCNVRATTENRAGKVVGILGGTVTLKLTGDNVTDDIGCFSEVTLTIVGRTPNSIDFTSLPTEALGSLRGFVHENAGHRKEITVKATDNDAEAKYIYYGVDSSDNSKNYKWESVLYCIANTEQIAQFRDSVNQGQTFEGKTVKLTADITVSDWTPIGQKDSNNKFSGIFDGNGKTVTINGIASDLGQDFGGYAAFFGATKDATIQNLTVAGTISGKDVAGIIGKGENTTLTNCHNNATINSTGGKAAGIAASFGGSLTNCTNSGDVTTSVAQPAGGLVAWCNTSTITECQNSGKVTVSGTGDNSQAGGLCGNLGSGSTVTNCSNSGEVSASLAGGVAGRAIGANTKIIAFSNEGTVTGENYAGGVIGDAKDGVTAQECTISGTISAANAAGGIFGSVHGTNNSAITNCAVTSCNVRATTENRAGKVVGILGGTVTLKLTGDNVTDDIGCFSEVTLTIVGRTPNSIDFTSLPTEALGSLRGFVHENAGHRKEITVKATDNDAEAKYIYYGVDSSDSSKNYKWETESSGT